MHSYGGFWIRVVAYLIDAFILQFATSIILGVVFAFAFAATDISGGAASSAMATVVIAGYALAFISNWLYFAIMESSRWQGTVGKQAFKLVVTDEHGERISFGRATGRYFAKLLSSLILMFGYFMVGWTQRKRGLHDMIAGTLVYKADSPDLPRNSTRVFE
jgi:uncharacterized RDD family membrane protein YckC